MEGPVPALRRWLTWSLLDALWTCRRWYVTGPIPRPLGAGSDDGSDGPGPALEMISGQGACPLSQGLRLTHHHGTG